MPPRLVDYAPADWLRLRPVTQALKMVRYRAVDRRFRRLPPRGGDVPGILARMRDRNVLIAIAFNDPQTIDWQARLIRHYMPNALHVVADNSPDDAAARAIADATAAAGAVYMRLPANLWSEGSRSHGLALNWAWQNLVKPGMPQAFGFIDDDIYPTTSDDPFAPLSRQDFYGVIREGMPLRGEAQPSRWFLWAGFCLFRYAAMRDIALDFSQDWFLGLDTGGANWEILYRHVDRSALLVPENRFVPAREDLSVADAPLQWCGSWLHAVGFMGRPEHRADKLQAVTALLAPHLARAGGP